MSKPRFSIVIPTRNRPETLRSALRTCLRQDFDDYEVVVCDNGDEPTAQPVVAECGSPRVRYVRAPRPLAMSCNWELALSHAAGEYILFLGDDDGLMRYALREIDALIHRTGTAIVRWSAAFYTWPTVAIPEDANYLRLPLGRSLRRVAFRDAVPPVLRFGACYTSLPTSLNAAVSRAVYDELRRRTGQVFKSQYPDVYGAFTLGWVAESFVATGYPMSIAASSAGSNGVANLILRGKSPIDRDFRSLNDHDRLPRHPWVPDLPVFPFVPVADSFFLAKQHLYLDEAGWQLDRRQLASLYVAHLPVETEADWQAGLDLLRQTFADAPDEQSWFDATLGATPFVRHPRLCMRTSATGFEDNALHLDTLPLGVTDVGTAVELCEALLGANAHPLSYQPDLLDVAAAESDELRPLDLAKAHALLRSYSAELEQLREAAQERLRAIIQLDNERVRLNSVIEEQAGHIERLSRNGPARLWSRVRHTLGLTHPPGDAA
jgi:glycosyltransferase involved in cell wall biosynthesis